MVQMHTALADDAPRPPGHTRAAHQPRRQADKPKRTDEAHKHQEEILAAMGDELVMPEIRDERSRGDSDHRAQRLVRGRAAPQPENSKPRDYDAGATIGSG